MPATILIVDDEREIRELLRYNLERQGYQVLTAQDGEEGLSRIFATHPDPVWRIALARAWERSPGAAGVSAR